MGHSHEKTAKWTDIKQVARGCKQYCGIDFDEDFYASVARMKIIRILFALNIKERLHIHHMDSYDLRPRSFIRNLYETIIDV